MKKSLRTQEQLKQHQLISSAEAPAIEQVLQQFSLSITPEMVDQIQTDPATDPIHQQFVPNIKELNIDLAESADPIGDDVHSKVRGIIHRYPDRCLLTPVHRCAVYCRFCFRRDSIQNSKGSLTQEELETAYEYIESHPEIWEVILTGGDPLILKPITLSQILTRLEAIEHVNVIRIHSRIPVVDPSRINDNMLRILRRKKALYIVLHANHAQEFTPSSIEACARLIDHGIPILGQTVLLKGVNDNIDALGTLMRTFVRHRIKPYYLHQGDLARGTSHFRTTLSEGQALMRELRGNFSGLCQPTYVIDIPGGYGKMPISPCYAQLQTGNTSEHWEIEDYQGQQHSYPPKTPGT